MSAKLRVVGFDPGPVPGLAVLGYVDDRLVQADLAQGTVPLILRLLEDLLTDTAWPMTIVGVERFVTRGRTDHAGRVTLDQVGQVQQLAAAHDVAVLQRTAAQVKHWATDTRLKAVQVREHRAKNLLELTAGMRHARDAARHAVFTASQDGLIPDPLSKRGSRG